ncbi:hypothetical protein N9100_00950 [Gammaproteobacteria bacterium]|nr:hypothetical protein [Gammaproteobacteria bacterium]
MSEDQKRQKQVARKLVQSATLEEKEALKTWADGLLQIREKNLPTHKKAYEALKHTSECSVVIPILKASTKELKKVGWDERSWKSRLGIGGVLAVLATVGNAGAGIAALGGAIGVPLWIVVGAGATFAGVILDEVSDMKKK